MANRPKCQGFAKTTQQQCQNNALLGTNYCWVHYPKKSPILFLFIGALLGLLLQLSYDHFTVSAEERKIDELTEETGTLHKQVNALESRLIKQDSKFDKFENEVLLEIKKGGISNLSDLNEIIDRTRKQYYAELDSDAENFAKEFKERIRKKQEAYEQNIEAQKQLSDKSLGYFASLLSYVLTYFDTTMDNLLREKIIIRSEKVSDEKSIDLDGSEEGKSVLLRRITLQDNKEIVLNFHGRIIREGKVLKDQYLRFSGKTDGPNDIFFSITPKRPLPRRGGSITSYRTIEDISYPADQDPMQNEQLKDKIRLSINRLIEEVYYPGKP